MSPASRPANIYIIGPQSTGKTTLVDKLCRDINQWSTTLPIEKPQIISEVARTVLSEHRFTAYDITSSHQRCLSLQRLILEAQACAEEKALRKSTWFISDRSGIDPLVYAKRYASAKGAEELQQLDVWIQLKARMTNSLIVVCESGTQWLVNDGIRLMPQSNEEWVQLFQNFCTVLDDLGLQFCVVPRTMTDLSDRAVFVRRKWAEQCGF